MDTIENPQLAKRAVSFSRKISLIVIACGLLVLVIWIFHISAFRSVLPGLTIMEVITSLAFLLASIALWIASQERPKLIALRVAQICSGLVSLIGLFTMGEYLFGWDLGIDQLIFQDLQTLQTSFSWRMPFVTALCFSLIGVALVCIRARTGRMIDAGQYLAVIVLAISFLVLVSQIYDVQALYRSGAFSSLALYTEIGLTLLALGILSLRANEGWVKILITDTAGGVVLRRMLPFVLGIPIVIGWLFILADRAGRHETHFGIAMISVLITGFLIPTLWLTSRHLNRIDADRKRAEQQSAYRASLLANVNDAIVATDAQFRLTAWNSAAETMYGWQAQEVLGRTSVEILQTEFPDIDAEEMRQKISEIGKWHGEANQLRKDGTRIPVELSSIVLHDANGQINGYLSVNRDITERKRAEEALKGSEERFRLIVESMPSVIIAVDHEGKISLVNGRAEQLFDYRKEELLGNSIEMLIPERFRVGHINYRQNFLKQPVSRLMGIGRDLFCLHRDGYEIPVEIGLTPYESSEGFFTLATIIDITERKEAEQALQKVHEELEQRVSDRTAELSSSEARFRGLFEHAPVSIWEEDFSEVRQYIDDLRNAGVVNLSEYFDLHPEAVAENAARVKIVNVNSATLEMYRAENKEQLLVDLSKVLGPESLLPFRQELLALARGETSFEDETINFTLDGEKLIVYIRLNIAPGYEQTWAKVFVSIADITERRQAEAALALERDLLQALMDNIPDTIYFKDTTSRFTRINRAQAVLLGVVTPEDAIGKTDLDFQASELAKSFYEEEQRIIETGEPLINRIEFNPTQDGQPRWFTATKVPLRDPEGRVIAIVGVSRDITELRQAEEALRLSEERFRLMAWATTEAVWDWDLQTNQIWWASGLQKIFRYSSETTQTDIKWWLDHIHPQDRDKVSRSMNQALEGGMEFWSKEYRFQRVDETYADIMGRGYIIRDKAGKAYRIVGAMMDITERKQAEATILHQNEMLSSLHQITLALLSYHEIDPLLTALVELAAKFMDAPYAEIMLVEDGTLIVRAATQNQPHLVGERVGRREALLSWQAFDTREPAVLSDYAKWPHRRSVYEEFQLHAVGDFPILNNDQCLGVLALGWDKPDYEFNPDQIQYGRLFANLTALVLTNVQLREALREQSIRDGLTGLYNRRYLEEALKQLISRVTRQLHPLGIIMLDIDHFKRINDTYGHAIGDALLRALGQLLRSHIRSEDIACRYGGEEFVLIMPDASLEAAQQRADHLRQEAKRLRLQEAVIAGITLSLGVAVYPQHGRTKESVLSAADAALYRAKQEGRDRVVVADSAS